MQRHAAIYVVVGVALGCLLSATAWPRPAGAETSIIPIPEVIVDPNEGTTVGLLMVLLGTNESKSISNIIAPDVRYNDITGVTPTFRYFGYPDPKQRYFITGGKGSTRGEYFEANYSGEDVLAGWIDVAAKGQHEQDPFERFFGFGNHTPASAETNYTSNTDGGIVSASVNLPYRLDSFIEGRVRHVRISHGAVSSLPDLRDPASGFSTIRGVDGGTIIGTRFGLAYDTRDDPGIPTEGVFGTGGIEVVDKALGSSFSFVKYGLEGKAYMPLRDDKRYVVALHGVLDYLPDGNNAPFFERNSVGGFHSLRGYGSHRFTDNHRFFVQSELRSNVYEREVFGVRAHLEIAPFLDLGKVFNSTNEIPLDKLHPVGGVGFRAVAVPQVVAYVDIGTSGGSASAFTGIDYPF